MDLEKRIEALEKQVKNIQEKQDYLCLLFQKNIEDCEIWASITANKTNDEIKDILKNSLCAAGFSKA